MKKNFLTILMLLCWGLMAVAMPAKPGWQTITQSDGTTLQVQAVGNAFNSAILTRDGLTVARGDDGDFYYTSSVTGITAMRAHEVNQRTPAEAAFVNAQRESMKMVYKSYRMPNERGKLRGGASNADSDVPAIGQRRIPIILVEFTDKKFNNTREDIISAMLTGNKSVGQYFRDQSNGMYEPNFEVFGIYTLSHNRTYYGGHSGSDNDKALGAMVTEACQLAASHGVSFKPYDTNSDDYCDVVIVIYAGVGEAQATTTHPEAVWPCHWNLSSAAYYGQGGSGAFRPSSGDPFVDSFAVFNELHGSDDDVTTIDGIGTFAHEFGHCLGLPDFYDTGSGGHYGMGYWDIMCSGCYNDNTYTPVGYTAYEKVFMGWLDYITPIPGTYYTLPSMNQKSAATDKAVRIVSDLNEDEYFIIEYKKKHGWDRFIDDEGFLVTHVTFSAERWWYNTPNNEDTQLMTILPADNSWSRYDEPTDLWPQGDQNAVTDNTTPGTRLYMTRTGSITGSAGYLGKPVTEMVINDDGTASFWYMKDMVTSPVLSVSKSDIDFGDVIMTTSNIQTFKIMGLALTGDVTLSLNDANGVFGVAPAVISKDDALNGIEVTVAFAPNAVMDYNATITVSSPGAQNVTVNLTGHGLIEGFAPEMQPANEQYINLTKFRAEWIDQTPPENLASYTLEVGPKPTYVFLESADFSDVPDAVNDDGLYNIISIQDQYLPSGWSATYYLSAYRNALLMAFGGTITTPTYSFTGYDKVTVEVTASAYYYNASSITISTSIDSYELELDGSMTTYEIVLNCAENDAVTLTASNYYTSLRQVDVYAGVIESVNNTYETYRLITGITDRFYDVLDLLPGGTFVYKVKALFIDGTESPWSNVEMVTLFENEPAYQMGDVNHDGDVDINDVTLLIDYLLGNTTEIYLDQADMDGNTDIDINDVTLLIDFLLQ